jgi:putative SOS response-associated peptidase YedK
MCGRYVSPEQAAIEREWHVGRNDGNPLARRFNTSPTTNIPILRLAGARGMEIATARWGLIPIWWKNAAPPTFSFNARLEEAADKPMWRHPLRHARCLVPAEGWYEWEAIAGEDPKTGKPKTLKQPHYLHLRGGGLFCFAGLLSVWTTPEQEAPVLSCAILTSAATGPVAEVHDRMPVVLAQAAHADWLDPARKDADQVAGLIRRHSLSAEFEHYTVSTAVNNSRSEGPQLIEKQ